MTFEYPGPGANDAPSYVVSGIPWVTGSTAPAGLVVSFTFPGPSRFIVVRNTAAAGTLNVGFSENGLTMAQNHHRFTLTAGQEQKLDLRVTRVFVSASAGTPTYEIIAGITTIPYKNFPILTGSLTGSVFAGIG